MLNTVKVSSNKKTGPIAVTYRAGVTDMFGSCPKTCRLKPCSAKGAETVDVEYMQAVEDAVPRNGTAWTYSHFEFNLIPKPKPGKTVFNVSTDSIDQALKAHDSGRPTVVALQPTGWKSKEINGVQFVQCPAELSDDFTCMQCGGGKPLCAQGDRDYIIMFTAHGPSKKRVGTGDGGCYGSSGPVAIQWRRAKDKGASNDAETVKAFAKSLPPGSMLRHHVVGDTGVTV